MASYASIPPSMKKTEEELENTSSILKEMKEFTKKTEIQNQEMSKKNLNYTKWMTIMTLTILISTIINLVIMFIK
jgi:K+/H+ antiporter YhaU regulatory subunit KhtT